MAAPAGSLDSTYDTLPEEQYVGSSFRRHSGQLLRAASRTLTGGAAVMAVPEEAGGDAVTRRRRYGSRRHARRHQVAQRVLEPVRNRFRRGIILFSILVAILALTMLGLFVWIVFAEITCFRIPCDQPLQYFLLVSLGVGEVKQLLLRKCMPHHVTHHPRLTLIIGILAAIPGWIVIGWGIHMIGACRTCQDTNPGLYYPTKYFVYAQIPLGILTTLLFSIEFAVVLIFVSRITSRAEVGCEEAVHLLPKVPSDSRELIDPEDGEVMECPICLRALEGTVVRTECEHYFHESCLARWCRNHVDCPLCRAQVGPIDGSEVRTSTSA